MNSHFKNAIAHSLAIAVWVAFFPILTTSAGPINNPPDVRKYHIDAGQSTFMVHAFVGGLFSGFGHNHNIAVKNMSGETEFTDGTVAPASLRMKVEANSLAVTDKVSDKDRQTIEQEMRDHVLE